MFIVTEYAALKEETKFENVTCSKFLALYGLNFEAPTKFEEKTMNLEQTTFSNFLAIKIIHVAGASHKMSRLSFFENEGKHPWTFCMLGNYSLSIVVC